MDSETVAKARPDSAAELGGRWIIWAVLGATAAVFWPVTHWIVVETVARAQIRQGFLILIMAAALVAWRQRRELRFLGDLGNPTLGLLTAAFALVGAAGALKWSLLVLPGFAFAMAGCLRALFGTKGYCYFRPLVAGFSALLVIILAFPLLDWPLRQLAGGGAAWVLNAVEIAPRLTLTGTPGDPQLILTVSGQNFLVATECNGFGLITSAALVAILAGGISGRRAWVVAALVPVALITGFAANVGRILVISLSAPFFPGRYHEMHEVAGTFALWAGLGFVVWLAWRPVADTKPAGEARDATAAAPR